jgi:hypothetical protein
VKRFTLVAGLAIAMLLVGLGPAQPAQAATSTKTVRYGPFTIPAGTQTTPGMIHNKLMFGVARPCLDCHITGFKPDLVYADGTKPTWRPVWTSPREVDTGVMRPWLMVAG